MDNANETSTCPDCGAIRYDYCGIQVCSDCYHKVIDEYEQREAKRYGTFKSVTGEIEAASPGNIAVDWKLRGL